MSAVGTVICKACKCCYCFVSQLQENPCQHPIVILKDVSYEDVSALLSFMYQGEVYITQDRLASFLHTAELLQVRGLTGATNPFKDSVSFLLQFCILWPLGKSVEMLTFISVLTCMLLLGGSFHCLFEQTYLLAQSKAFCS
jgi:hypothetical protein